MNYPNKRINTLTIALILSTISLLIKAQNSIVPSINLLQGTWKFEQEGLIHYLTFKNNRSIGISYIPNEDKAYISENPYSYYGFWDPSKGVPYRLKELNNKGKYIYFYDILGESYDSSGKLLKETRSSILIINDNEDNVIPKTLSFFYKSTPDFYEKVDEIPLKVQASLKRNKDHYNKFDIFRRIENKKVSSPKAIIYKSPGEKSKMYLVQGDEIEILNRNKDFLYFRFYGNKLINGWIRSSDLE